MPDPRQPYQQGNPQYPQPPYPPPEPDRLVWRPYFPPDEERQSREIGRCECRCRRSSWVPSLVAVALLLFALILGIAHFGEIKAFLATMADICPGHTPQEKTVGLLAFGLVGVLVLAVVRILVSNRTGR